MQEGGDFFIPFGYLPYYAILFVLGVIINGMKLSREAGLGIVVAVLFVAVAGGWAWFFMGRSGTTETTEAVVEDTAATGAVRDTEPKNSNGVSALAGLQCDNWNRRPIAAMYASDFQARPTSGFSKADMVFELPVTPNIITRFMAVYQCNDAGDMGSLRSSRHDFLQVARSIDAVYVHWGGSHFALDKIKEGIIENLNCNNDGGKSAENYCYRRAQIGKMRSEDTGYMEFAKVLQAIKDTGYRATNEFSGYPHAPEAALADRGQGGTININYPGRMKVSFDYDRAKNAYLRTWDDEFDIDRNNSERLAPKNVAVLEVRVDDLEGQYVNLQFGDPWYDSIETGPAHYFMNGKTMKGTWYKSKSAVDSKLYFYDEAGKEISFVPGQTWVSAFDPMKGAPGKSVFEYLAR